MDFSDLMKRIGKSASDALEDPEMDGMVAGLMDVAKKTPKTREWSSRDWQMFASGARLALTISFLAEQYSAELPDTDPDICPACGASRDSSRHVAHESAELQHVGRTGHTVSPQNGECEGCNWRST